MDTSRETFLKELTAFIETKSKRIVLKTTNNHQVFALCRYATVHSNLPPVIILHGTNSGAFHFVDFMESFPLTYNVYSIDLPGWGISNEPPLYLSSAELNEIYLYYGQMVMSTITELDSAPKFTFIGHSFGSFLLVKIISNGSIPTQRIHQCILGCLPGLAPYTSKYHYFWGFVFIYGLAESTFKQWWSKYLFRPWLFRGNKSLIEILNRTHRFISPSTGYQLVSRQMTFRGLLPPVWKHIILDEIQQLSNIIHILLWNGIHDTLVDIDHARKSSIQLYEFDCGHSLFSDPQLYPLFIRIIEEKK